MRYSRQKLYSAILLALWSLQCRSADDSAVVLLTGFEPFGGAKINESWETVKTFQGQEILGYRIETALLPVVYDEMNAPLQQALEKYKPSIVISFGVGSETIQVETVARNSYHPARPPDNKGQPPPRAKILPDAPNEIDTALPVERILAGLKEAKIGCTSSRDAGGYLCNECFYRLMHADAKTVKLRGFVHVPQYGTRDPEGGVFDAEKLKRAVRAVIEATVKSAVSK